MIVSTATVHLDEGDLTPDVGYTFKPDGGVLSAHVTLRHRQTTVVFYGDPATVRDFLLGCAELVDADITRGRVHAHVLGQSGAVAEVRCDGSTLRSEVA